MAQFISTCPYCQQQFAASDELVGQNAACPFCGAVSRIQIPAQPYQQPYQPQYQQPYQQQTAQSDPNLVPLILGILSMVVWIIPFFTLPVPIIGFIMSHNRNYRMGVILSAVGAGLNILWTFICLIAAELD